MFNSRGSAATTVILVIFLIIVISLAVVLYYPAAQPARDLLVRYVPSLSNIIPLENAPEVTTSTQPSASTPPQTTPGTGIIQSPVAPGGTAQAPSNVPGSGTIAPTPDANIGIPGLIAKPFGLGIGEPTQPGTAAPAVDSSPAGVLKACMSKLQNRDIIGAEQYVSENGKEVVINGMKGVHKLLLKNLVDTKSFDEIGYNNIKINGQTCWVPLYTNLGANNKMVGLYIILANRGNGWLIDDLYNPQR